MEWDWGATDALGDDLETLLESEATLLDFATPSDKPQAVAAVGLRCLDASHAAGCTLCVPAPPPRPAAGLTPARRRCVQVPRAARHVR